jgi:hypothetical protein
MADHQPTWLETIKAKRRRQIIKAIVFVVIAECLWLAITAVGVWVWVTVFHRLPPGRLFLDWMTGLGSLIVMPLGAIAPLAPMKGPDPEVIAADEFFRGPPR